MSRAVVILKSPSDRAKVARWAANCAPGTQVEFKSPRRNLDQNAILWVWLGKISAGLDWYGQKLSTEDWKDVFTASLRRTRVVPGIDAGTFVPLGMRTSDMTKDEFSDLLELIAAFAAERGIDLEEHARVPA